MKKYLVILALPLVTHAAPFVVSDAVDPTVTHCGVLLDAAAKVTIPVTVTAGVKTCKYDLATLASGSHTVKMTAIIVDPVWGTWESAQSLPLVFNRLGAPGVPAGLKIIP